MDGKTETIMWMFCFGSVAACVVIGNLTMRLQEAANRILELEEELNERR
jgi:uncharacterized membrane-anchored protein YhcB (DUF1043 family)